MSQRGRPPSKFIADHFTKGNALSNNSHRFLWCCKYCPEDNPRIEGRDNRLYLHITNPKECPNAPREVRHQGLIILANKGKVVSGTSIFSSLDKSSSSSSHSEPTIPDNNVSMEPIASQSTSPSLIVAKKRKQNTLDYFVDRPLSESQKSDADVKLFR